MMKPINYYIRYQNLSVTGQKVKCILSSITSLQKVKDDINGNDIDIKDVMILFQCRNKNNLSFTVRVASQSKFLNGRYKMFMKFLPSSAKLKYRYWSFCDVYQVHEVVKDVVDEKCMMFHGANDSIEDKMLRMKANVSTTNSSHSGSCSYSSIWLEKADSSRGMESYADVEILQTFSSLVPQCGYPGYTSLDTQGNVSQVNRLERINLLF